MAEDNNDAASTAYLPGGKHTAVKTKKVMKWLYVALIVLVFASKRNLLKRAYIADSLATVWKCCDTAMWDTD